MLVPWHHLFIFSACLFLLGNFMFIFDHNLHKHFLLLESIIINRLLNYFIGKNLWLLQIANISAKAFELLHRKKNWFLPIANISARAVVNQNANRPRIFFNLFNNEHLRQTSSIFIFMYFARLFFISKLYALQRAYFRICVFKWPNM